MVPTKLPNEFSRRQTVCHFVSIKNNATRLGPDKLIRDRTEDQRLYRDILISRIRFRVIRAHVYGSTWGEICSEIRVLNSC